MSRRNELEDFFQNYKFFLESEAIVSFIKGRNYDIIKHFYHLFIKISQVPQDDDKIKQAKISLKNRLEKYKEENQRYTNICFTREHKDVTSIDIALNKGQKISQAFSLFTDAIKQYREWRKSLNQEQIKEIYLKNLYDKQKYYFNTPPHNLNQYLADTQASANNNILRQSLIEFHNAISHLNAVYWNTSDNQINTDRAANHFKRGALDSYKAIIKDFCLLAGENPMDAIIKNLKALRQCEYQSIGDDKQRDNDTLYKSYQAFTSQIIDAIKK